MSTTTPAVKTAPTEAQTDDHPLAECATDETTVKRARWEHFRFAACPGAGRVNVCNVSHGVAAKADHTSTVAVAHGMPTECSCKSFEFRPGMCKHMLAVAAEPDVIADAEGE